MIFLFTAIIGCSVILLQLYNAILLAAFWPFFAIVIFLILTAMLQFALLIFARRQT